MKILLTSDNHLGYLESDPLRGMDSFNSFKEVLEIGEKHNVDMILHAGDLFHINKPSRNTFNEAMALFRRYCLGAKEIALESSTRMNFHDKNINVKIPFLAIHGNHDDPCGFGSLSAMDILHTAGLINYFGKCTDFESIEVQPIIFKKGSITVAVYGLGHIKDARLHRAFLKNKIKFVQHDRSNHVLNILLLHQNRIKYEEKEFIPEEFIDDMFDIVIYGHEHQSLTFKSFKKDFLVVQTGSTVRTSLCEAESETKYCYILDVFEDKKYELTPKPLVTVRDLIFDTIILENTQDIEKLLDKKIHEMIQLTEHHYPLIRLRIQLINGTPINKYRFGAQYKGKVANPYEILHFIHKKSADRKPIQTIHTDINDIIYAILKEKKLYTLSETLFMEALETCTDKQEKKAFEEAFTVEKKKYKKKLTREDLYIENKERLLEIKLELEEEMKTEEHPNLNITEEIIRQNVRIDEEETRKNEHEDKINELEILKDHQENLEQIKPIQTKFNINKALVNHTEPEEYITNRLNSNHKENFDSLESVGCNLNNLLKSNSNRRNTFNEENVESVGSNEISDDIKSLLEERTEYNFNVDNFLNEVLDDSKNSKDKEEKFEAITDQKDNNFFSNNTSGISLNVNTSSFNYDDTTLNEILEQENKNYEVETALEIIEERAVKENSSGEEEKFTFSEFL